MSVIDIQRRYAGVVTVDRSDEEAHDALIHNGGFSRHIQTGEPPKTGYMVGLHADRGGEESVHDLSDLTAQHIAEHRARARSLANPHMYQGGWVHDGKAYLDRSLNIQDRNEAMEWGRAHKQLAIWDVAHGKEIPLGE